MECMLLRRGFAFHGVHVAVHHDDVLLPAAERYVGHAFTCQ